MTWEYCFSQTTTLDSTWTVDKYNYHAILDLDSRSENDLNTSLTILRGDEKIIIDSVSSSRLYIKLRDMNGDSYTDFLVYQGSGARSNETFNLYLYRPTKLDYKKVEGFNDWPNLNKTELKGILSACILTGTVKYRFFEVTDSGELIDLNISEIDSLLDGEAYKNGLLKVRELKE